MTRLALACALAFAACDPGSVDDRVDDGSTPGEAEQEITTSNKLSLNKLSLNKLSLNKLSLNGLSAGAGELAATEDGRELLTYVARCALPEGDALVVDGIGYPGLLGLAPAWQDGACDEGCQRWVSACLLAHVNALGVEVPISIRGVHPSIAIVSDEEAAAYPVEEAGFYGDLFAPEGAELEMYACLGRGLSDGQSSSYLDDRLCASSDACGFTHTGVCAPATQLWMTEGLGALDGACLEDAGPRIGYTGCTDPGGIVVELLTADLWFEVVTVYLRRS